MVRAELRSLDSPDAPDLDPADYTPDDPMYVGLPVTALIGPKGERGEELFYFYVCTPQWLADDIPGDGYRWGQSPPDPATLGLPAAGSGHHQDVQPR